MNVAVVGGHSCSERIYKIAQELGQLIAQEGWILICGGSSGVMEAACKGAKEKGGLTVGILPSYDGAEANDYLDLKLPTGLGYGRNILVVRAAEFIIAVDGNYGTLSEIAFAFNDPKPVIGIETWDIKGVVKVNTPKEAIQHIKEKIRSKKED